MTDEIKQHRKKCNYLQNKKMCEVYKFSPNDLSRLAHVPAWVIEKVFRHQWQGDMPIDSLDMNCRFLTLEEGFQLGILGQLLAFGLTYDQTQQAFAIAEKGFTNPDVLLPENSAQSYKGREWLPDCHLLIDNWSLCAAAHTYQLRETDNLAWFDVTTGMQTTKICHPVISTARIPISDFYNWLLHVLPTEPNPSPDR